MKISTGRADAAVSGVKTSSRWRSAGPYLTSRSVLMPWYGSFSCIGANSAAVLGGSTTRPISRSFQARSSDIGACCAEAALARGTASAASSADLEHAIPNSFISNVFGPAWPIVQPILYRFHRDDSLLLRYATV